MRCPRVAHRHITDSKENLRQLTIHIGVSHPSEDRRGVRFPRGYMSRNADFAENTAEPEAPIDSYVTGVYSQTIARIYLFRPYNEGEMRPGHPYEGRYDPEP